MPLRDEVEEAEEVPMKSAALVECMQALSLASDHRGEGYNSDQRLRYKDMEPYQVKGEEGMGKNSTWYNMFF